MVFRYIAILPCLMFSGLIDQQGLGAHVPLITVVSDLVEQKTVSEKCSILKTFPFHHIDVHVDPLEFPALVRTRLPKSVKIQKPRIFLRNQGGSQVKEAALDYYRLYSDPNVPGVYRFEAKLRVGRMLAQKKYRLHIWFNLTGEYGGIWQKEKHPNNALFKLTSAYPSPVVKHLLTYVALNANAGERLSNGLWVEDVDLTLGRGLSYLLPYETKSHSTTRNWKDRNYLIDKFIPRIEMILRSQLGKRNEASWGDSDAFVENFRPTEIRGSEDNLRIDEFLALAGNFEALGPLENFEPSELVNLELLSPEQWSERQFPPFSYGIMDFSLDGGLSLQLRRRANGDVVKGALDYFIHLIKQPGELNALSLLVRKQAAQTLDEKVKVIELEIQLLAKFFSDIRHVYKGDRLISAHSSAVLQHSYLTGLRRGIAESLVVGGCATRLATPSFISAQKNIGLQPFVVNY